MMDTIFKDMEGCVWYLDDILIYGGDTEEEHQKIVEKVLQLCVDHGLAVNLGKSEFHVHVKAQVRDLPKMGISQCPTSS